MAKLLDPESKPMLFLGGVWDAFVLHLIWIVCCIPVVTAGPATVALYFALMKDARNEGSYIRDFFRAFKRNFKQGMIAGLIYLVAGGIIGCLKSEGAERCLNTGDVSSSSGKASRTAPLITG